MVWLKQNKVHIEWKPRVTEQYCCSVAKSSSTLPPHGLQHARLPSPSLSPRVFSNSYPLSQWCHPTVLSSVTHFFSCLQSFPASGSFPVSQFFVSGGQRTEASASASILPIQGWFPLGLTGLISLLSRGLSRIFSSTRIWKHQFFGAQPSFGFLGGSEGKESACNVGDLSLIPGLGRSSGGGQDNPLQYSCLGESPWHRGDSWATAYGVAKSRTRLRT